LRSLTIDRFLVLQRIRKVPVVFTHIPRAGAPIGNSPRKQLQRVGAIATTVALGVGFSLVAPLSASAATVYPSYAQAQFLSGSLLGGDLADVVALEGAEATNDGTEDKKTSKDPLHATALDAIDLEVPGGVQLDLGSFLDAGAVNQYAEAEKDGKSMASSGAIGDDGAIGVGAVGGGAAGDLNLDLGSVLTEGELLGLLSELKLSLEAVSAQAVGNKDAAIGDYTLAGAKLNLTSPAISNLTQKVLSSLDVVDDDLLALTGSGGGLALRLAPIIQTLAGLSLGADADVSVSITADLDAAVTPLLTGTYGNGAVSFNLQSGTVQIDLEKLLGGSLNDLPPNTELISSEVLTPVLKGITDTIQKLIDDIIVRVDQTLRAAKLDVHVGVTLLENVFEPQQLCETITKEVIGPLGATVDQVLNGLVGGSIGGVNNGLPLGTVLAGSGLEHLVGGVLGGGGILGGLFGGGQGGQPATNVTTGVIGHVTSELCSTVQKLVNTLETSVVLDVEGTLSQILSGDNSTTKVVVKVAGVPITVNVGNILKALGLGLTDGLFDNDGAVKQVLAALNLNLLDPAVDALLGDTVLGLDGLGIALDDVLSILVNVQERFVVGSSGLAITQPGSYFTETAVRVSVLNGGLTTLNVAAATVGPNVTRVIDPGCTTNCGPNPPCVGANCPPGGGDPNGPSSSASNRLAMTGVGIATLIAVILALLAAGAYLAREGYRRNHPQSI
jgi:hypothetical protein